MGILRELSPQRAVSLYKDQEDSIKELSKDLGRRISYSEFIRASVDVALKELSKEKEMSN